MKAFTSTLASFWPTFLVLAVVGVAAQVLDFSSLENYLLGAFFALVHPFVEKYRINQKKFSIKVDSGSVEAAFKFREKPTKRRGALFDHLLRLSKSAADLVALAVTWLFPKLVILLLIAIAAFLIWSRLVF